MTRLEASAIHVWRIPIAGSVDPHALDRPELERAARFHRDEDRLRFIASHAGVRAILGSYLGVEGTTLRFEISSHGKPRLANGGAMRFNLAHSGQLALLAVACDREVGVDVERHSLVEHLSLARGYFSPAEVAAIAAASPASVEVAFFRCWSRKEAFIKACGLGLSLPLDTFDVTFDDERRVGLSSRPPAPPADGWSLEGLDIEAGYSAAVAWQRTGAEGCVVSRFSL